MKTPLRILALIIFAAGLSSCGRPAHPTAITPSSPSKQEGPADFAYQDFIPLIQLSESFVQETSGALKTKFTLQTRPHTNLTHMRVVVNGEALIRGYSVSNNQLVFETAPLAGAQIAVTYDPENFREGMAVRPLIMPENLDLESIRARFNYQDLYLENLRMSRNSNGEIILDPSAIVFDYQDSYQLQHNRGLHLEVFAFEAN